MIFLLQVISCNQIRTLNISLESGSHMFLNRFYSKLGILVHMFHVKIVSVHCCGLRKVAGRSHGWHPLSVPLSPSRQDQIKSTRQMHKACVHPSITLSLSFFLFFFSPLWLSLEKDKKIKVRPPSTWSCRRINFHILVLSDPLTVSRNVALSSQVIYD